LGSEELWGSVPTRYDREILLAARYWEGSWVSMQDIHKGPPPDNGLEVMYQAATLGERMLGHDEPIRVAWRLPPLAVVVVSALGGALLALGRW
jgi:hypothetical protein